MFESGCQGFELWTIDRLFFRRQIIDAVIKQRLRLCAANSCLSIFSRDIAHISILQKQFCQ